MQNNTLLNRKKQGLIFLIFTSLAFFNYACDSIEPDVCEEVPEICEEEVRVCSNTGEEYYVLGNDTIYCAAVGNCTAAVTSVTNSCTVLSAKNELEIKQRLESIMTNIRLSQY